MVKEKKTKKLKVTKVSDGPLSKYKYEHSKCTPTEEVNKTLLKIMEKIEQLEIAFLLLKKQRSEQ
tara:strand:+ start:36 stop:230 length:195 start_codon:yes stop_codon:yes gene_type:complete